MHTCRKVSLRWRDRRADSRLDSIRRARRRSSALRFGSICASKRLAMRLRVGGLAATFSASLPAADPDAAGGAALSIQAPGC